MTLLGVALWLAAAGSAAGEGGDLALLDAGGARLVFVDPESLEVRGEVSLGGLPQDMSVAPDGRSALVSDSGNPRLRLPGARVFRVDLAARALAGTFDLGGPCRPLGMAWSPDGSEAWVTCQERERLVVLDASSGAIRGGVPLAERGGNVLQMAPDGHKLWVLCQGTNRVVEIDTAARKVLRRFAVGGNPTDLALAPGGREIWVLSYGLQEVEVVDLAAGRVTELLPAPAGPLRLLFAPDGARAIVLGGSAGLASVYDPARRVEIDRVRVGTAPMTGAFSPDGALLAIALSRSGAGLALLDQATLARRGGGALPFVPWGVAWAPRAAGDRTGGGVDPSPQSSK